MDMFRSILEPAGLKLCFGVNSNTPVDKWGAESKFKCSCSVAGVVTPFKVV